MCYLALSRTRAMKGNTAMYSLIFRKEHKSTFRFSSLLATVNLDEAKVLSEKFSRPCIYTGLELTYLCSSKPCSYLSKMGKV